MEIWKNRKSTLQKIKDLYHSKLWLNTKEFYEEILKM